MRKMKKIIGAPYDQPMIWSRMQRLVGSVQIAMAVELVLQYVIVVHAMAPVHCRMSPYTGVVSGLLIHARVLS